MKYSHLPSTEIEVSRICLGTMTWGSQNSETEAHEQMDYAVSQGVNFFDTAELYAVPPSPETQGLTETYIGTWFCKTGKRKDIVLASKMAGAGMPWINEGRLMDGAGMRRALERSLLRLQTDYIDLYQLHWPNRGHYHFGQVFSFNPRFNKNDVSDHIEDMLATAQDMLREGKIRAFGLSNETAWGVSQYLKIAEQKNLPRISTIQNEYSLTCRIFEPDLAETCLAENVGLLAYSPLTTGAISGKYLNGQIPAGSRRTLAQRHNHRANPATDAAISAYMDLATARGLDVCQMALAFALSRPFMTSVIIGATRMEQLRCNIDAINVTLDLDTLKGIDTIRRQYPIPH